jgi:hypothetical protein
MLSPWLPPFHLAALPVLRDRRQIALCRSFDAFRSYSILLKWIGIALFRVFAVRIVR